MVLLMSVELSQALIKPEPSKQIKYNLITTISDDMNTWYHSLKNTIAGRGNKYENKWYKDIIANKQITTEWEKRQQERINKRKSWT